MAVHMFTKPMCVIYIRNRWMYATVNSGNRAIYLLLDRNFRAIDTVLQDPIESEMVGGTKEPI